MNTEDTAGQALHSGDDEIRREAARIMGSSRSDPKAAAARVNQQRAAAARRGKPITEEHRENLRRAQAARWERIRAERAASGVVSPPAEKRKPGRPRQEQQADSAPDTAPKRGRGRPRKDTAQTGAAG